MELILLLYEEVFSFIILYSHYLTNSAFKKCALSGTSDVKIMKTGSQNSPIKGLRWFK